MIPHPSTMHVVTDLRRGDLLAIAARERQAERVSGPGPQWRPLPVPVLALMALLLGLRR